MRSQRGKWGYYWNAFPPGDLLSILVVTLPFFQYYGIAWPGAKVTQVGEPCYGWPYCTVQRALVYVMQVNVYEKAVVKFRCSFRRRPYLCFYDGPRTRSFFSRRETFELRGTITSSIYTSFIPWNNSNFKSFTCFNYSCYGCGSINSVPVGFWGAGEIVGILWKSLGSQDACQFHTTRWSGTRSASWLMSRYWFLHTTIFFSYRRIRRDVNRQPYLETTISGYWYCHCTASKGLGIQWCNVKRFRGMLGFAKSSTLRCSWPIGSWRTSRYQGRSLWSLLYSYRRDATKCSDHCAMS